MKYIKITMLLISFLVIQDNLKAQCNQTMTINSLDAVCDGTTSTVTINVTVLFGNGNNSVTISYNTDGSEVVAAILEDDAGDIINQTYIFNVPTCDNYTVTLTAWTNPAGGGSSCTDPAPVTSDVVLPVTFGDFTITTEKGEVSVKWTTLSEINNEKFEIQRSKEGKTFMTIGEMPGHINSTRLIEYEYIDHKAITGRSYYRIKQVDLDGNFSFSEIRSNRSNTAPIITFGPNPAMDYLNIQSTSNITKMQILDPSGAILKSIQHQTEASRIDISDLNSGQYYLVDTQNFQVFPFIKM